MMQGNGSSTTVPDRANVRLQFQPDRVGNPERHMPKSTVTYWNPLQAGNADCWEPWRRSWK